MTRGRWIGLAVLMAVSFVVLAAIGDGLALAAALMFGVAVVKAAECGASK